MRNSDDTAALTEKWTVATDQIENAAYDAMKQAQDHAYNIGLARGRSDAAQFAARVRSLFAKLNNEPLTANLESAIQASRLQIADELRVILDECAGGC